MTAPTREEGREARVRYFEARACSDRNGCWLWCGHVAKDGYGWASCARPYHTSAHRLAYELYVGAIPPGLHIDHLCRNRRCVNPSHLEAVTPGENALRGMGLTAINARLTACFMGHPLAGDNLYVKPNGTRCCRTCKRARNLKDKETARRRRRAA